MNYYPGNGLIIGTAVLGEGLGQVYPVGTVFTKCKIYGVLLTGEGAPVGSPTTAFANPSSGTPTAGWKGVTVSATPQQLSAVSGKVITVGRVDTVSNQEGYFELYIIQGLLVSISCAALGKTLAVDTTGLTQKDLSSLF